MKITDKKAVIIFMVTFVLVYFTTTGCKNNREEITPCPNNPTAANTSYSLDVYPVIANSCAIPSCHVTGFEKGNFTRYEELKEKADNGTLKFMIITNQMPHSTTKGPKNLSDCDIELIKLWIEGGAQNN